MKNTSHSAGHAFSLLVAGCLLLASPPLGVAASPSVESADEALSRFELDAAIGIYRAVLKQAPDDYPAHWKLARSLCDKGTLTKSRSDQQKLYAEADSLARRAVTLNPQDSKGHVQLAVAVGKLALFEGGKRKVELAEMVRKEAKQARELNPNEDVAFHVLGVWHREMAELNWALRKFAEILYGKLPSASMEQSMTNLLHAVELAPAVVSHRVELGLTYSSARKWEEAQESLDYALAMPKAWVTDDHYRAIAEQTLRRVRPKVQPRPLP